MVIVHYCHSLNVIISSCHGDFITHHLTIQRETRLWFLSADVEEGNKTAGLGTGAACGHPASGLPRSEARTGNHSGTGSRRREMVMKNCSALRAIAINRHFLCRFYECSNYYSFIWPILQPNRSSSTKPAELSWRSDGHPPKHPLIPEAAPRTLHWSQKASIVPFSTTLLAL